MKNSYNDFFKTAQKIRLSDTPSSRLKDFQKRKKQRKSPSVPWKFCIFLTLGTLLLFWAYLNSDNLENLSKKIEIGFGVPVLAETSLKTEEKKDTTKVEKEEKKSTPENSTTESKELPKATKETENNSYYNKLAQRKQELDLKEAELKRMEDLLQKQRLVVEEKIQELEKLRDKIQGVLKNRVEIDSQKLEKLVQFYSDMRPQKAAQVFETLDEDLVVEVLGKMKKKNAADILNLIKAEKAQLFTEKIAGYKK